MKLPAYFVGYNSKADGSYSIRFTTQELTSEEASQFHELRNTFGWLVYSEGKEKLVIPKEPPTDTRKTPSQRLRSVLYVWWEQQGGKGTFDAFYNDKMEKIVSFVKNKLV